MRDNYEKYFSESGFWDKARIIARKVGHNILEPGLKLFYAARDPQTPAWAKAVIYSALGYLISPVDAVPDVVPMVGYSDDLAVLIAALTTVAAYVTDEHASMARATIKQWLG